MSGQGTVDTAKEIASFDSSKLKRVETKEAQSIPSPEVVVQEKQEKAFRDSIEKFSKGDLQHAMAGEKKQLPDAATISQEKTLQNITQFDKTQLKHTQTAEGSSRLLATQEKAKTQLESFDKGALKPTSTTEKQQLPDTEAIAAEKKEQEFKESISHFSKENLRHSYTTEKNVLPDAATIGHEKTLQNIENFDVTTLKHAQTSESQAGTFLASQEKTVENIKGFNRSSLKKAETAEKQVLPASEDIVREKKEQQFKDSIKQFDKTQLKLKDGEDPSSAEFKGTLDGISGFDKTQLKHTQTAESSSPRQMVTQEKAMEGISKFDKTQLKKTETSEKQSLPDTEALKEEKKEQEFRESIQKFPKENLRHSFTQEKTVLPDAATIGHEKTMQNISGFDKDQLKHTQTAEPPSGNFMATKESAIRNIEGFDKSKLRPADTTEKQELPNTDAISVEKREKQFRQSIEGFPKDQLRKSLTSEKNVLPGASEISQEKTLQTIGSFDKSSLKHTQTAESKPTVFKSQEKTIEGISGFDKSKLKPTEVSEKCVLPDDAAIKAEKRLSNGTA